VAAHDASSSPRPGGPAVVARLAGPGVVDEIVEGPKAASIVRTSPVRRGRASRRGAGAPAPRRSEPTRRARLGARAARRASSSPTTTARADIARRVNDQPPERSARDARARPSAPPAPGRGESRAPARARTASARAIQQRPSNSMTRIRDRGRAHTARREPQRARGAPSTQQRTIGHPSGNDERHVRNPPIEAMRGDGGEQHEREQHLEDHRERDGPPERHVPATRKPVEREVEVDPADREAHRPGEAEVGAERQHERRRPDRGAHGHVQCAEGPQREPDPATTPRSPAASAWREARWRSPSARRATNVADDAARRRRTRPGATKTSAWIGAGRCGPIATSAAAPSTRERRPVDECA
jgi:hypothetical protein